MATKIINEIDSYEPRYHFKIGITFMLVLATIIFIFKNTNNNDFIPFVATFNYVEGINNDTEVKIAGIKIGNVSKVTISSNYVVVKGLVDKNYDNLLFNVSSIPITNFSYLVVLSCQRWSVCNIFD